jgi:hypothetical protein
MAWRKNKRKYDMKKDVFLKMTVMGFLVTLIAAACSPSAGQITTFTKPAVTRTISVTKTAGATGPQFVVITIPALTQTATLAPITGTPPQSLHTLQYPYDYCFQCHPIPPGHEGRDISSGICFQ